MITVVIPVYNSERYLEKCLQSVFEQNFEKYKVVLVDDGSTDNSKKIIERYMQVFGEKLLYIYQENRGQSAARNNAFKYIDTKYITFLDSDDYIAKDYLEKLVAEAEMHNSDMVASGQYRVDEEGKIIETIEYKFDRKGRCFLRRLNFSGKIYRMDFIREHKFSFAEGKIYEDNPFNIKAYALAKNLRILNYMGYYQVVHLGSTTTKKISIDRLPLKELEEMVIYIRSKKEYVEDYELYEYTLFSFLTYFLFKANKKHYYFDLENRKSDSRVIDEITDFIIYLMNNYFPQADKNLYVKKRVKGGISATHSLGVAFFCLFVKINIIKPIIVFCYKI